MAVTISGSTGIANVDGSVSAPSTRGQDSNSGISYAADTIKFSTGGVERLAISNSGLSVGIIKTVHNYKTDTFSSTAEDAWTNITGVTLTNTPAATGNKHMGVFYLNFGREAHHTIVGFRVTRSIGGATATVISNSVAAGTSGGAANYQSQLHGLRAMYDVNGLMACAVSLYDAPSTTSECVYQVQFYSEQASTFYLNRSSSDATVSGRGTYQGILQEVSV